MASRNQYKPDYVSPPGETLADLLEEREISQAELARRSGFTTKHINKIVKDGAPITHEMALTLEHVLGVPAEFWNNREARYREFITRQDEYARLKDKVDWLSHFPVREMVKWDYIRKLPDKVAQLVELLDFFGVASPEQWRSWVVQQQPSFRINDIQKPDMYALSAWLRQGERIADAIECSPFSAGGFEKCLQGLRSLTTEEPEVFVVELEKRCAQCGVAVVFLPALSKTGVHGATRWVSDDKVLIQLSVRYRTDDMLWFAFFHEACHVLRHRKRQVYLQDGRFAAYDEFEAEANRFAAETLIPSRAYKSLITGSVTKERIKAFADEIGIAPGIVVGRLQHDGIIPFRHCNDLKQRYEFKLPGGEAA